MSESWKNRLWQLVLVCTFAVVLSVCQKAVNSSSDSSSSSGTAFADGSTVTISSLPSVTVSSAPMPTISAVIHCGNDSFSSGVYKLTFCDSTDSTSIDSSNSYSITLSDLVSAGFQPCSSPNPDDDIFFCK